MARSEIESTSRWVDELVTKKFAPVWEFIEEIDPKALADEMLRIVDAGEAFPKKRTILKEKRNGNCSQSPTPLWSAERLYIHDRGVTSAPLGANSD